MKHPSIFAIVAFLAVAVVAFGCQPEGNRMARTVPPPSKSATGTDAPENTTAPQIETASFAMG